MWQVSLVVLWEWFLVLHKLCEYFSCSAFVTICIALSLTCMTYTYLSVYRTKWGHLGYSVAMCYTGGEWCNIACPQWSRTGELMGTWLDRGVSTWNLKSSIAALHKGEVGARCCDLEAFVRWRWPPTEDREKLFCLIDWLVCNVDLFYIYICVYIAAIICTGVITLWGML